MTTPPQETSNAACAISVTVIRAASRFAAHGRTPETLRPMRCTEAISGRSAGAAACASLYGLDSGSSDHAVFQGYRRKLATGGGSHTSRFNRDTSRLTASAQPSPMRCNHRCTSSCGRFDCLATDHSITSSARCSRVCGMVSPSAAAVLRLITSSNRAGRSIGRSPGSAPFRIRST
jgi:hypothetical protein